MSAGAQTDLVVIGAGVVAASIAFHCAQAGVQVTMLTPGGSDEATATQTAGAFRTYFPGKVHDSELVARSLAEFRAFGRMVGADLAVTATDMLVVADGEPELAALAAELPDQRAVGVRARLLSAAQAAQRNPWLDPATIAGAVLCPQFIRLRADRVFGGYLDAARRLGARVVTGVGITGIDAATGRVETAAGAVTAGSVVLAAGADSTGLAASAGLELPVWAQFAELFRLGPVGPDAASAPFTFHAAAGLKTMGMSDSFLVGLERLSTESGRRDEWRRSAASQVHRRYPRLAGHQLVSAWTGALDATASTTAVIGRAGGRVLAAAGFTGHELAQAPMAGQLVRDLHLGRHPAVDPAPFAPRDGARHAA
ncbi:NAD(P)/FAD-dependent oxidoreductase [Mangrovihabitans endophyticus]|uniref:Oxidoreductase n=1 Tax=Mangrovihabitans endophyticus TaxID=1751298 RepID=A0A8J3BSV6_9ACTN|nr:FAD-binding oxidoreductase [Mangrovihabitans endophyticus]GGK74094.1 oxidoreductase [Mangrovihabitans endophyticus]